MGAEMNGRGLEMERVVEAVRGAMDALEEEGVVDIEVAEDGLEVDVIGEEWTVHLEGWPDGPIAFLAIDDEPDDPKKLATLRVRAITPAVEEALVEIDGRLDGGLRAALVASGDPLSIDLAAALAR